MNRKPIRESVKKEVSYRQSYKCYKCFELLPPTFQIDHIIPWCISNNDDEENLQALCANCHSHKTQKETMRIIQYKRILSECPKDVTLCWFCVETSTTTTKHSCNKILKDIPRLVKSQCEIKTSFEEMCNRYKYIKKEEFEDNILKIKVALYSNSIYVDHVIVKFTDELDINHIVDAVFMATRSKKNSKKYETIHFTIETANEAEEKSREACMNFIKQSDILEKLPPRIFKDESNIVMLYIN